MLRPSRQLATALLWLAIALLPLRGAMAAAMPVAMGSGQAHSAASMAVDAGVAVTHDCHGADSAAGEAGGSTMGGTHTCSLCSLCHSTAAAVAAMSLHISAVPPGAPPAHASRDIVGAVFDAPERPPRLLA